VPSADSCTANTPMVIRAMNVSLGIDGHRPPQVKVGPFRNSNAAI
jgi:hypothetical protein